MKENAHREGELDSLFNKAMLFYQAGDLRNAVIIYKQILRKEPENDNAFNLLGVVYSWRGNHDAGISLLSTLPFFTKSMYLIRLII